MRKELMRELANKAIVLAEAEDKLYLSVEYIEDEPAETKNEFIDELDSLLYSVHYYMTNGE